MMMHLAEFSIVFLRKKKCWSDMCVPYFNIVQGWVYILVKVSVLVFSEGTTKGYEYITDKNDQCCHHFCSHSTLPPFLLMFILHINHGSIYNLQCVWWGLLILACMLTPYYIAENELMAHTLSSKHFSFSFAAIHHSLLMFAILFHEPMETFSSETIAGMTISISVCICLIMNNETISPAKQ